ncbi:MAG: DUF1800 domain-containing protein [Thermoanaerobaculia bacterium]
MKTESLSRRGLLKAAAGAGAASALPAVQAFERPRLLKAEELDSIAAPFSAPDGRVAHLLHRATYGVRPGELERARTMGIEAWLDEQLHPERIDDAEAEAEVAKLFPTLRRSAQELFKKADDDHDGGWTIALELKKAAVLRALRSKRQLYEVMVEFWSNHFSMFHFKDGLAVLKTVDDRDVTRRFALGKFREILLASARSPAMLTYLDNEDNVAAGPNENYARELMELHAIGVDAGYTQQDVREVARCFTGWTVDYRDEGTDGNFLFDPDAHDFGPKRVLGVAIAGGEPGVLDGRRVIEALARQPACARHISAKLCRRFVSDVPPESLVSRAAAAFTATGGDVRAVLKTILLSEEFFAAPEAKLKRPFEFLLSALRALEAEVTAEGLENLIWSLYPLGQVPFHWEPPNGYPDVGAAWANTNGLMNRWNLASSLVLDWWEGVTIPVEPIVARTGARTAAALVDALALRLLQRPFDPPDRTRLIDYVAQGRPATARLPLWYIHQQAPGLIALILGSPYFQWR